jgi:hypothetical protein
MSIIEVPVLPFRAGRHLVTWIVWQASQVSWIDDVPAASLSEQPKRRKRRAAA